MLEQKMEEEIELLGKGTYGCVFSPNLECDDRKMKPGEKYVSKIQKKDNVTKNEIEIGKKLILYPGRFGPIIGSCPMTSGKIEKELLKKCDIAKKEEMITSNIRYIGKNTLDIFFQEIIGSTKSTLYLKQVVNKHLYLLNSLVLLNRENVLHLDIKSNNIMIDDITQNPIFIDFGISYDASKLQLDEYKKTTKPFGIMIDYYTPWCFEIILLTNISRYLMNKTTLVDPMKEQLVIKPHEIAKLKKDILGGFIKKNAILQMSIFTQVEKQEYLSRLQTLINGFEGKTWAQIWNLIIATKDNWDNYALSVVILSELELSGLIQISRDKQEEGSFNAYIQMLKQILLGNMSDANETMVKIKSIFTEVTKNGYEKVAKEMKQVFSDGKIIITMNAKRQAIVEKSLHEKNILLRQIR